VAIAGSASDEIAEPYRPQIEAVASWISVSGLNLLTGGGNGVMKIASEVFVRASPATERGVCLGAIPGDLTRPPKPSTEFDFDYRTKHGYPNAFVEVPILTQLQGGSADAGLVGRNHVMALSPDVLVAMVGGSGTMSEAALAMNYGTPLIICAPVDMYIGLAFDVDGFQRYGGVISEDPNRAIEELQSILTRLGWVAS
jgi:predicted Rossmann-fold nucleotide-binding protein